MVQGRKGCPPYPGAATCQGDVPLDAGGGSAVRRSIHEIVGVTQKRNVFDLATLKTNSQYLARVHGGPSKGKAMR